MRLPLFFKLSVINSIKRRNLRKWSHDLQIWYPKLECFLIMEVALKSPSPTITFLDNVNWHSISITAVWPPILIIVICLIYVMPNIIRNENWLDTSVRWTWNRHLALAKNSPKWNLKWMTENCLKYLWQLKENVRDIINSIINFYLYICL